MSKITVKDYEYGTTETFKVNGDVNKVSYYGGILYVNSLAICSSSDDFSIDISQEDSE